MVQEGGMRVYDSRVKALTLEQQLRVYVLTTSRKQKEQTGNDMWLLNPQSPPPSDIHFLHQGNTSSTYPNSTTIWGPNMKHMSPWGSLSIKPPQKGWLLRISFAKFSTSIDGLGCIIPAVHPPSHNASDLNHMHTPLCTGKDDK